MVAVSTLVSPPSVFYQYFKINLWDFLSAMIALFVTIFVSVETGIAAGVAFSLVVLLFRVARPNFHILRQLKDRPDVFVDEFATKTFDTEPTPHGILVFRIEESTTFPNTETFKMWVVDEVYKYTRFGGRVKKVSDRLWSDDLDVHIRGLRRIAHGPDSNITDNDLPKLRAVILDFSAVNNIDSTGLQGLFDLRELLKDYAGVADYPDTFFEVHFVGIQANVLRILELSGITRPVGPIAMQKVEPLEDIVVETASNGSETSSSRDTYGSHDQILSNGGDHASRDQSEIDESGAEHQKDEEHELGDWNREVNHASLGSGSLSAYGASPFLKEEGLVHLTVRDAIDAVLVRNATWRRNIVRMTSESSDEEEERNKNKP
ncbi:hypothetical protein BGZ74_010995 [Mortierella antarctica]|nr:hypothetical protein BGZ74_010995 [Mortierella antarctica]